MSPTGRQRDTVRNLFHQKGLVRMRDLRDAGVVSETVARLVREGAVTRVTRGLYQLAEAVPGARSSFAEASALVPKGVIGGTNGQNARGRRRQSCWLCLHLACRCQPHYESG